MPRIWQVALALVLAFLFHPANQFWWEIFKTKVGVWFFTLDPFLKTRNGRVLAFVFLFGILMVIFEVIGRLGGSHEAPGNDRERVRKRKPTRQKKKKTPAKD